MKRGSFKLVLHVFDMNRGTRFTEEFEADTLEELTRSLPGHIHMYLDHTETYGVAFSYLKGGYLEVSSFELLERREDGTLRRCPEYHGSLFAWYEYTAIQECSPSASWEDD